MTNKFEKLKLKRADWISLIQQKRTPEFISSFENYKKSLKKLVETSKSNKDIDEEIKYTEELFTKKVKALSAEFLNSKDYYNALKLCNYLYNNFAYDKENIHNYIKALEAVEQYDLGIIIAKELLQHENTHENYKLISKIYDKNKDYQEAIDCYYKYLKLIRRTELDINDNNTLGCLFFNKYVLKGQDPKDAQQALDYFVHALKFDPTSKIYLKNTINAAIKAKNYAIEKKCWEEYIKNGYASKDDEFTYSASCIRNGDIKGWAKYYNSRFKKNEPTIYPKLDKPEWTGKEDISNSTLLVHYEQGYGDNFLMWGYMPRLVKMAKKVIYYIQNNAYDLVKDNEFGVQVCSQKNTKLSELQYDYHIPCMSIPIALDLDKNNISVGGGYIKANKEISQLYKEKYFNTDKFKIGIAFNGIASNAKRDIPIESLKLLDNIKNVQFYCLNTEIDDKVLKCFKNNNVINLGKEFKNFSDTAAAIENTDIIISSDNCVLNLAGAMGKRTIGIFNYHYEFRWYDLSGNDCGWFKSVKPIVNNEYNNWDISIKKAMEEIEKYKEGKE